MKKILITAAMVVACAGAFAQGKVSFGNDASHLLVFTTDASFLTAPYKAMAGLPVSQGATIGAFTAELWGGTAVGNMVKQSTVVAGQAGFDAGRLANVNVTLSGIAAGSAASFQVKIYETAAGSFDAAQAGATWVSGKSSVFTTIPGSLTFNSIVSPISPAFSTWGAETIQLAIVPEPSTMALAGLGAAALLIFRRRK